MTTGRRQEHRYGVCNCPLNFAFETWKTLAMRTDDCPWHWEFSQISIHSLEVKVHEGMGAISASTDLRLYRLGSSTADFFVDRVVSKNDGYVFVIFQRRSKLHCLHSRKGF